MSLQKGTSRKLWFSVSIRINMQWQICFEWPEGQSGPSNVEIVDYH
jgi:plasmid maintenance system killer protein